MSKNKRIAEMLVMFAKDGIHPDLKYWDHGEIRSYVDEHGLVITLRYHRHRQFLGGLALEYQATTKYPTSLKHVTRAVKRLRKKAVPEIVQDKAARAVDRIVSQLDADTLDVLLDELTELGLEGSDFMYDDYSIKELREIRRVAKKYLPVT